MSILLCPKCKHSIDEHYSDKGCFHAEVSENNADMCGCELTKDKIIISALLDDNKRLREALNNLKSAVEGFQKIRAAYGFTSKHIREYSGRMRKCVFAARAILAEKAD